MDGRIEEGKEDDQQDHEDAVNKDPNITCRRKPLGHEFGRLRIRALEHDDNRWNAHNRLSENDRHDAAHENFNGNMGALTAVHFPSHDALRVLNGYFALPFVKQDDEEDDGNRQGNENNDPSPRYHACCRHAEGSPYISGESGYDPCKDE